VSQPRRRPLRERRYSNRAVEAAKHLDRLSSLVDGERLAEVQVGDEVVDMRIVGGPDAMQCRTCGSAIPRRVAA
jgi:hypothetical protein